MTLRKMCFDRHAFVLTCVNKPNAAENIQRHGIGRMAIAEPMPDWLSLASDCAARYDRSHTAIGRAGLMWSFESPGHGSLPSQEVATAATGRPVSTEEAERCKVPAFAIAIGQVEKWKLHNNCK